MDFLGNGIRAGADETGGKPLNRPYGTDSEMALPPMTPAQMGDNAN
jgi:hypothetical protein